jgi:hypothetical protein
MRRSKIKNARRNNKRGLTLLTIICVGGLGFLLVGWNARSSQGPDLTPSEVIALRFPDPRNDIWNEIAEARAAAVDPNDSDEQRFALFNPNPTLPQPAATPVATTYVTASIGSRPIELAPQRPSQSIDASAKAEPKVAAVRSKPAAPPVRGPSRRPGAVLSDGQIASIKTRLNLTADQQQMWPAVEQALRGLSYTNKPERGTRDSEPPVMRTATVDPSSEEVQRLKSAAFPLIMSFSDEQKRELRILAHVAGLEKLAAQF